MNVGNMTYYKKLNTFFLLLNFQICTLILKHTKEEESIEA